MDSPLRPALEPANLTLDLSRLYGLVDGWLDGQGRAPSRHGLDWLNSCWKASWPVSLPVPYAYPLESGGVCLEWSERAKEASLEVCLVSKTAELQVVDVDAGEVLVDYSLRLDSQVGWDYLVRELHRVVYPG